MKLSDSQARAITHWFRRLEAIMHSVRTTRFADTERQCDQLWALWCDRPWNHFKSEPRTDSIRDQSHTIHIDDGFDDE